MMLVSNLQMSVSMQRMPCAHVDMCECVCVMVRGEGRGERGSVRGMEVVSSANSAINQILMTADLTVQNVT